MIMLMCVTTNGGTAAIAFTGVVCSEFLQRQRPRPALPFHLQSRIRYPVPAQSAFAPCNSPLPPHKFFSLFYFFTFSYIEWLRFKSCFLQLQISTIHTNSIRCNRVLNLISIPSPPYLNAGKLSQRLRASLESQKFLVYVGCFSFLEKLTISWLIRVSFSVSLSLSVGVLLYLYLVSDQWHFPNYKLNNTLFSCVNTSGS